MDGTVIVGGALAFSAFALPLVWYLDSSNKKKDLQLLEGKILVEVDKRIDAKIDKIVNEINHKKIATDQLDKITARLIKITNKIDPYDKMGIYDI